MKDRFCFSTVFCGIQNIHLIKDPGMIPYTMFHEFGYDCTVPLSSLCEYPYKKDILYGIEAPVIQDSGVKRKDIRKRLFWIYQNAVKIDVLNVFFFDRYTWLSIWLFLRRNPEGLVYVHCDTDGEYLLNYVYPKNVLKSFIIKKVLLKEKNLESVLWGVQNKTCKERLQGIWPFFNVEYVPDCIYLEQSYTVSYAQKKNQIITVANNGTAPKRTDILLNGFARVAPDFPEWNLMLVGTVDPEFRGFLDDYFIKNPSLKDNIEFIGPVYDRKQLAGIYAESKVFCLTSAWESFGIATAEAISKGCFVVASDIPANRETTDNGRFGLLFENGNVDDFAEKLRQALQDEERIYENMEPAIIYAHEKFSWRNSLKPVNDWIIGKRRKTQCE